LWGFAKKALALRAGSLQLAAAGWEEQLEDLLYF